MSLAITPSAVRQSQDRALRQELLDNLVEEQEHLRRLLAEQPAEQGKQGRYQQVCQKIVDAVERVLETGDWSDSLFLRNTLRPLIQLRDQILAVQQTGKAKADDQVGYSLSDNQRLIYISVYQSQGNDLACWERHLSSLADFLHGRAIYSEEEHALRCVRARGQNPCEAYVVAAIDSTVAQAALADSKRTDSNNFPLLNLREGSVSNSNILEFVHHGRRYAIRNGRLVLNEVSA